MENNVEYCECEWCGRLVICRETDGQMLCDRCFVEYKARLNNTLRMEKRMTNNTEPKAEKGKIYFCIKEVPTSTFEDKKIPSCNGYLFEFECETRYGLIVLYSIHPTKDIRIEISSECFDEYFRDISKMTLIDTKPTNNCESCCLSYRYHNTGYLDDPEWQNFCSVDGHEITNDDDSCPVYHVASLP